LNQPELELDVPTASPAVAPPVNASIEAIYATLCQNWGIARPPVLKVMPSLEVGGRVLLGEYRRARHEIMVAQNIHNPELVLSHELCHVIAGASIGYKGHHGAPFLALWSLADHYFLGGRISASTGELSAFTIQSQWLRVAPRRYRKTECERAHEVIAAVKDEMVQGPLTIDALAIAIRTQMGDRARASSFSSPVIDRFFTQKAVWKYYTGRSAVALLVAGIAFHMVLPNEHKPTVAWAVVTILGGIATICAACVYIEKGLCKWVDIGPMPLRRKIWHLLFNQTG
jgi:hypothetical protein